MFNVGDKVKYNAYNVSVNSVLVTGKVYNVTNVTYNSFGFGMLVLEGLDTPDVYYMFAADMFILEQKNIDYLAITREFG